MTMKQRKLARQYKRLERARRHGTSAEFKTEERIAVALAGQVVEEFEHPRPVWWLWPVRMGFKFVQWTRRNRPSMEEEFRRMRHPE